MREQSFLLAFWGSVCGSGLREFLGLLSMFRNWRNETLKNFGYQASNGFVEGKNNRISVIKRMDYGYCNINNLRRGIFLPNAEIAANAKISGSFYAY